MSTSRISCTWEIAAILGPCITGGLMAQAPMDSVSRLEPADTGCDSARRAGQPVRQLAYQVFTYTATSGCRSRARRIRL